MPPPPKHRGREEIVGMPPPERRLKAPLMGSGSSGGAMAPPEHRLKAPPLVGSGFSGGAMVPPERRGKGTGSRGETPLANLSNLIGSPGFPVKEPPATATQPQRVARERKYARPWSSSSPRDPSVRTGQQQRSAKTYRRRFSLLSINDAGSPTSQAHLSNTAAAASSFRYSAAMLHPLEKPGTGLSGGRMPSSPSASLTGGRTPRSPSTSLSGARMPMPSSPSTSLSGARMLPSSRLTVKAGAGSSIQTPRDHQLATGSPQKHHQAVTGSPQKHQAAMSSPWKHQAVADSPQKHQAVTGSPQKHQVSMGSLYRHHAATSSPRKHQAALSSQKHQAATSSPQKHQAALSSRKHQPTTSSPRKHQPVIGSLQKHQTAMSSPHKHLNVTGSNGEKPRKHRYVRGSNVETPQKHQGVLVSSGATLQMDRMKDKVGRGLSGEMTQKSYSKERTRPAHHLSSTRRTGTVTELQATSAKCLNKNTSFTLATKSSLRTNQKLRRRNSSQASNGLSLDADHGNTTVDDNKGSTAKEDGCLTVEMIRIKQEVELQIRQLNELGHGEDISYEEFKGYLERLPCSPPHVDTSFRPNYEQINELQICSILYHIKYCKFTRQKRMNGEMLYKLEDDHPLYHLEEKLECLEEDISKLEGDDLLYYLEKEGLLRQIENDELFDWSFHYTTIDGLDDYQRLIPQNYGYEYARWDTYRDYFHSYEIELEYLMYWKELLKELKWMEDYVLEGPSPKFGNILTRGCYQAVKIASRFSKITESLARGAYHDCIDTMRLDISWYKEFDGVFFEIWQRTTMLKENFKEALKEVFESEKFPLRHQKMKYALENDCSEMEKEFRACTAGITPEVKEDIGRELIAEAIKNKRGRPKFYAQYIKKKIEVAKAIGVIPAVVT